MHAGSARKKWQQTIYAVHQ